MIPRGPAPGMIPRGPAPGMISRVHRAPRRPASGCAVTRRDDSVDCQTSPSCPSVSADRLLCPVRGQTTNIDRAISAAWLLARILLSRNRMTAPRPVFPGQFVFLTRRCTQRQFLLRPDEETNNAFVYCLAEAAAYTNVEIVLSQMMSNHHHTMIYDPHGNVVAFKQRFHQLLSKCQNALRGRWEGVWSGERALYRRSRRACRPRRQARLHRDQPRQGRPRRDLPALARAQARPGIPPGTPLRATRPSHFFRDNGPMPAEVELVLRFPERLPFRDELLAEVARRIADVEAKRAEIIRSTGRGVLGRGRIKRQSWHDSPTSIEPRRELRPRVAARSKWARIDILLRNKLWRSEYNAARAAFRAGRPAVFPYGTYWLRKHANITVAPPHPVATIHLN